MFWKNKQANIYLFLIFLFSAMIFSSCGQESGSINMDNATKTDSIVQKEVKYALEENILDVWFPRIVDNENGGFYTKFNYKFELESAFPKMIVSQARDVWVASKAAQRYPEKSKFSKAAKHGFKFLKNKMWDKKYGGFYFNLPGEESSQKPALKRAYGNAFAIYALAEYYQLTQDEEAKELAQKTFEWMNKTYYDSTNGGYFDWATRDGISFAHDKKFERELFPEDAQTVKYKDYNSTIHILEAFTSLYKIWKDETLKDRLQESFHIVRDTMVNEKGHLDLYFEKDWEKISIKDSSKKYIKKNNQLDHVTFGHDIETAYLLLEAGEVLHLNNDKTHRIARNLVDHTVKYGFDDNYAGIFYTGYYFKGDTIPTILNKRKSWWPQAEGLNGLLLYSYLYPENKKYKTAFYNLWHYTKKYIIDQKYGGWYRSGIDIKGYNRRTPKAYAWKSCYHNYRALENLLEMLQTNRPIIEKH